MNSQIITINPHNEEILGRYDGLTKAQVEAAVAAGHAAATAWRTQPLEARAQALRNIAAELRRESMALQRLVTTEMGKVIAEAAGEIEKSAVTAIYYADHAQALLADRRVEIDGVSAWISYEPVGLILAVMPWNFPIWQVMRCALPALLAGNGVLLKHSPNVSGCALAIERIIRTAGLPEGLFTALIVAEPDVPEMVEALVADPRIASVSLTGSNRAGAAVGAAAGRAAKPSVLELGGSDAFVILDDADLEKAVPAAIKARFHNAGQSCVCAKRFIVARAIAERFVDEFVAGAKALVVGAPEAAQSQMGPMARADLRDGLHHQVQASIAAGAVLLCGGTIPEGSGYYYEPTVLVGCKPGVPAFDEETFGPLAAITVVEDDAEAIALANATQFGLSISIWSASRERALNIAKNTTTGAAFINAVTASDARVPFGGTRKSGYGRELAAEGLHAFTNVRTYWVNQAV